jgi:hypothetical protein
MSGDDALGRLTNRSSGSGFASTSNLQISAWTDELAVLRREIDELVRLVPDSRDWTLLLEYEIPRRQKRIDAVLLTNSQVFSIELKLGSSRFERADRWQAEDYALDLRDFHLASRGHPVIPVLVATKAQTLAEPLPGADLPVHCVGADGLAERIAQLAERFTEPGELPLDPQAWDASAYSPTPSIIQATQQLFSTHTVANLSHTYADNLDATVAAIDEAVRIAQSRQQHTICFVTGVPGAGKTLAGLAAVHAGASTGSDEVRGAYLSGNGPLVRVLREAVALDAASRSGTKEEARRRTETLIQNVHEFLEEYGVKQPGLAPDENIVIFDEAQRAWNAKKLSARHASIEASEPALMLDIMSRKPSWAAVVALIGGGQEIHTGEAGLEEWGRALAGTTEPWRVVASPEVIVGGESVASHRLFEEAPPHHIELVEAASMHLSVSVRSPRARHLAEWVNAVLELRPDDARESLARVHGFRIGLTRSLDAARAWLRDAARGEFRAGLLASSGNLRLRTHGLEMSPDFLNKYPLEHWFLAPSDDFRSSHSLEVAMSEFKVQGLELDLVGLCWGDDLTVSETAGWEMRNLRGASWTQIRDSDSTNRGYLLNKYRVLLTRAREGMVIWVPRGSAADPTRDPARLDRTASHLLSAGVTLID